jgi:predicted oxidoreductase (fatty acid repression mutant protein)
LSDISVYLRDTEQRIRMELIKATRNRRSDYAAKRSVRLTSEHDSKIEELVITSGSKTYSQALRLILEEYFSTAQTKAS